MSTSNLHKLAKEQFVSDLSGSSTQEIVNIMLICIPLYYSTNNIQEYLSFNFVLHFVVPLFMVTVYNDQKLLLYFFALAPLLFIPAKSKGDVPTKKELKKTKKTTSSFETKKKKKYLTAYRSHMLILTSIAILAVDFEVFPRKLAKVETWGTSLMDLGVGSFIFSSGIVSRTNKVVKEETKGLSKTQQKPNFFKRLIFRKSNILFVIGLLRLFFVKNLEYQEHVTEYGKHWNFFITLGLLPLTHDFIVRPIIATTHVNRGLLGFLICVFLELWMNLDSRVLTYLINADRVGIVGNNREGIYSFWGYIGIFLMGQEIGNKIVLPAANLQRNSKNFLGRYRVDDLQGLAGYGMVAWLVNQVVLNSDKFYISRRFANLPYALWVVSYNLGFLTLYCFVDKVTKIENDDYILECINNNGLLLFLIANVSTGLVNMCFDTLAAGPTKSICILLAYCGFLLGSAVILNKYKIRL